MVLVHKLKLLLTNKKSQQMLAFLLGIGMCLFVTEGM